MELDQHSPLNDAFDIFINKYFQNPYKYIFECDLQVLLSAALEQVFDKEHCIERKLSKNASNGVPDTFDIRKVHREYPSYIRFDNVVLDEPIQKPDNRINISKYESFYMQPVKYAIELKYVALNENGVKNRDNSHGDYKRFVTNKLETLKKNNILNYLEYGIQLTIFQHAKEQEEFIKNHFLQRYSESNKKLQDLIKENTKEGVTCIDYCYLDVEDHKIKSVFPKL